MWKIFLPWNVSEKRENRYQRNMITIRKNLLNII